MYYELASLMRCGLAEVLVMDRPIDRRERSKKLLRRYSPSLLIAVVAIFGLTTVFGWILPSVSRSGIRTAIVERGIVEATITASGTVVPLYEHVVTSPIEVRSGDTRLRGSVSSVRPMVENGVITLEVALEEKQHPVLRHNLRMVAVSD
jgi:hypothetical protein